MTRWLEAIRGCVGGMRWVLIGDWNAHHASCLLDGKSDAVGRVLEDWRHEQGARLLRGREHTFERRRGGGVVVSRIDFALAGGGVERGGLSAGWGFADHSAIGCVVAVDDLMDVVGYRDAVDWMKVQVTVEGEGEEWYVGLVGVSAYKKLIDFRRHHLKTIKICGRSKRWWDSELSAQVRVVRRERRGWRRVGHRNVLRSEIAKMKRMVKEKKDKCWRALYEDSGLQSPWEVVRWARDPWRERERMGRLKGSGGVWVESDEGKVRCLVSEVFGVQSDGARVRPGVWDQCPMSSEDLECSVRRALGKTKNGSAPGPDGISYRLIKAVKDTRLGR